VRLHALHLRGFKSFADPIHLPLHHRLMTVIGPNGCGKSNIADALRWLVGEQKSRLLRIEKTDNLIFNGSARRKPLPYAEVSLEVADFSPELPRVIFTKRVHRGGDIEYLINNQSARLKDFLSYFWEMGLSPHSFLDGGQVEALIQDRGGARRALLESLAGIEKYHHQRKELLTEIEKTRQSLSEVDHLIAQLSQQILLLTQQAQRVEKYHALKDQYQTLLKNYIAAEVAYYRRQIAQIAKEEEALTQSLQTLEKELELLRLQLREDKRAAIQQELSLIRAAHEELLRRQQRLSQEESRLQERIAQLQKQRQDIAEETAHRHRQEKDMQATEAENLAQLEALAQQRAALLAEVEALLQTIEAEKTHQQSIQQAYQSLQQEIEKTKQELSRLSAEKNRWEAQKAAVEREKQKISAYLERLRESQATAQAELAQKGEEIATLRQNLEEATAAYQELEKRRNAIEQELAALRRQLGTVEADLRGKVSERTALESLFREAAHWPPALRRLIQAHPDKLLPLESVLYASEAILPLLAFLLRIEPLTLCLSDPALLPEVEKALAQEKEGLFQVFLSSALPQPEAVPPAPLPEAWHLSSHIQTLPGWEALPHLLWGNIWVVQHPEPPPPHLRYLHPEKKLLRAAYYTHYFLGVPKTAHIGLPHRIQALREVESTLTQQIHLLKSQVEERAASLRALPLDAAKKTMQEAQQKLIAAEKAFAQIEARLTEAQKALSVEEGRLQALQSEEAQHQQRLQPIEDALAHAQRRLADLEEKRQALSQQNEAYQKKLQNLSAHQAEKRYQLAQIEERLRQEEKHQRLLHQQLSEVRKRLTYLRDQEARLMQELTTAQANLSETQKALAQAQADTENIANRRKGFETELQSAEKSYKEIESTLYQQLSQREALLERRNRLVARRQEAEHRIQMMTQRLEMEVSLSLGDLPEAPGSRLSADEVERQLQTLRQQMTDLGELNFEAFTTLQQEKARMESYQSQRADISQALERLEKLLITLDREAAQRFTDTFEAVRQAFIRQFRELFSEEDTCDLVLVEPDKPLSSGIDIIARPRGKRPLSITQLSGGEKALTVLALLMGMLSIRPPALIILDEVDASLDDVNADKFGRLLRRFGEVSQILVITHNKITMSYAEVLYGVTMPEPGVSTVLGVEMAQALQSVSAA
jgi:chromosome segregation protein